MQFRRLGKTQLQLSVFSLETVESPWLQQGPAPETPPRTSPEALAKALDHEINHLILPAGDETLEEEIGRALATRDREKIYLNLRIPPCACAEDMRGRIEASMRRLGVERIDLITLEGVDGPEELNMVTNPTGCLMAVEQWREQGRIGHVGFQSHGPVEFLIKVMNSDLFEFVVFHYGYFYQRNLAALDRARNLSLGVIIESPTQLGGRLDLPAGIVREMCGPFHPIYVNHRFIFQHAGVTSIAITAREPGDFEAHAPAFDCAGPIDEAENLALAQLDVRRRQLPDSWCTHCHQCLPCPEGVHIPEILRLRNLALAYDMTTYARQRYQALETGKGWFSGRPATACTECGECVPRCPEKLDIPSLLQQTHARLGRKTRQPVATDGK